MDITIQTIKGTFHGIYEWGLGWDKETANKWDSALRRLTDESAIWKSAKYPNYNFLVSIDGSIFLHPMNFTTVLSHVGANPKKRLMFQESVKELWELCTKLAEKCGGTFTMEVSEEQVIDSETLNPYHHD